MGGSWRSPLSLSLSSSLFPILSLSFPLGGWRTENSGDNRTGFLSTHERFLAPSELFLLVANVFFAPSLLHLSNQGLEGRLDLPRGTSQELSQV